MKVIIVEDEVLAQQELSWLIKEHSQMEIVGTFDDGLDVLKFLQHNKVDALFLDINIPSLDGVLLAQNINQFAHKPFIVFVTAWKEHAVEAFELEAFDYILKPVKYYDFALKLHWALEHLPEKQEATILLVSGGSKIRLRLRDLLYAETDGHYLIFHTAEGQIRQCGTISTLEADLTNKQFVRCNSCYLVNLQHIAGIKGYSLLLDNGEELKISQPRKKQVQQTYNEYLAAH